jgi:hypothetical protein
MTATASPKEEVRKTAGRFSFQTCGCANPEAHGYFHLPDEQEGGDPHFSKAAARDALKFYIKRGEIPADQQTVIEEDINLSNLSELEDRQNKGDDDVDMLIDLLVGLIIAGRPDKTAPDGTFFFEEVGCLGYINNKATGIKSIPIGTKGEALESLTKGVSMGSVGQADEATIKKQIEESNLPD